MNSTAHSRARSLLILGSLSVLAGNASAVMAFNIDFGSWNAAPASSFGASAAQPGVWNQIQTGGPLPLVDLAGAATTAQISVSAQVFGGQAGAVFPGDLGLMMNDNFYSNPGNSWSLTVSGLANGTYDFFYYAPPHSLVDTGAFTINGIAAPNRFGTTSGSGTVQGLDWQSLANVPVTDGTLTTTWLSGGSQYTGLSGIQIIPTPEPGSLALLVLAGASLGLRRKRTVSV